MPLAPEASVGASAADLLSVPAEVFDWLEAQCLRTGATGDAAWLKLTQRRGRRAIQVTSYVGVIRAPNGYQIEVLPKVGKGDRRRGSRGPAIADRHAVLSAGLSPHSDRPRQAGGRACHCWRSSSASSCGQSNTSSSGTSQRLHQPPGQPSCATRQAADRAAIAPQPGSGRSVFTEHDEFSTNRPRIG